MNFWGWLTFVIATSFLFGGIFYSIYNALKK